MKNLNEKLSKALEIEPLEILSSTDIEPVKDIVTITDPVDSDAEYARQNLKNLILTRKGERIMQPEFGCDIYKILFEPIITDESFENKISNTITEAVNSWLPYIKIDRININYLLCFLI